LQHSHRMNSQKALVIPAPLETRRLAVLAPLRMPRSASLGAARQNRSEKAIQVMKVRPSTKVAMPVE